MGNLKTVETYGRVEGYEGLRDYGDAEENEDVGWIGRLGDIMHVHCTLYTYIYYYYYYYFIDHTNHRRVGITVGAQHYTHNSLTGINTYTHIRTKCLNHRNIPPTPNT